MYTNKVGGAFVDTQGSLRGLRDEAFDFSKFIEQAADSIGASQYVDKAKEVVQSASSAAQNLGLNPQDVVDTATQYAAGYLHNETAKPATSNVPAVSVPAILAPVLPPAVTVQAPTTPATTVPTTTMAPAPAGAPIAATGNASGTVKGVVSAALSKIPAAGYGVAVGGVSYYATKSIVVSLVLAAAGTFVAHRLQHGPHQPFFTLPTATVAM